PTPRRAAAVATTSGRRRIAVAGFMHESNTFNPLRTDRAAFAAQSPAFGPAPLDEWRRSHPQVGGVLEAPAAHRAEAAPPATAWATPSGPVADAVLDEVTGAIIDGLKRERPDGLLLALHGAMVAESHPDADGEVLARIRRAVGTDFPVVVTLDLHGNLSQRLIDHCDATVAYRTCPHVDQRACGLRAAEILRAMLHGEVRPRQALAKPPVLVNIMVHDTSCEPLRSFMEEAAALEQRPGILRVNVLP